LGVNLKIKINYSIENQYLLNLQKVNYYHPLKMDLEIKKKITKKKQINLCLKMNN